MGFKREGKDEKQVVSDVGSSLAKGPKVTGDQMNLCRGKGAGVEEDGRAEL